MSVKAQARREDEELVEGILAGDERCFSELYERYHGRIYGFACRRLRDTAEAEDVTQDVFLEVHRCLDSFEGKSTLLTWMFGIAHFQICRRFRRQTPGMVSLDAPEAVQVATPTVPAERRVDASRVLADCGRALEGRVNDAQREVFQLRYGENHSTRSIAQKLGKSRQAVKISLFRTRRAMAQHANGLPDVLSAC